MILKKMLCLLCVVLALSGCSSNESLTEQPVDDTISANNNSLSESAISVGHSLVNLAKIEQAANPTAIPAPELNPSSYGMDAEAAVDWSGPIEPLIKHLAEITGYRMRRIGTAPAIPIIVTISKKHVPVANILRDAAYQCGKRANVIVFPQTKVIEVRYAQS